MNATTQQVQINGIAYDVVQRTTPEDHDRDGRRNLADTLREQKIGAQLYLRRPNGKVVFFTVESEAGRINSSLARLGRW